MTMNSDREKLDKDFDNLRSIASELIHENAELKNALHLHKKEPEKWQAVCKAASKARLLWNDTAKQYIQHLYT